MYVADTPNTTKLCGSITLELHILDCKQNAMLKNEHT